MRVPNAALYLDEFLAAAFLRWSVLDRHNSQRYVAEQRSYLAFWREQLAGVDLHQLAIARDVLPAVDALARGRRPRLALLKVFCSWLYRERHALERDPVDALKLPQSRPAQWRRRKVVAHQVLERTLKELEPTWHDVVTLLCGTGWHVTEAERFARAGAIATVPAYMRRARTAAVLETVHKHGELFRTCVSREVLRAARRVRGRGHLSIAGLRKAIRRACGRAGVPSWGAGQLRHTVATWAVRAGEDLAAVAAFLGHRDARTTRRFYVELYTAPKVATPR